MFAKGNNVLELASGESSHHDVQLNRARIIGVASGILLGVFSYAAAETYGDGVRLPTDHTKGEYTYFEKAAGFGTAGGLVGSILGMCLVGRARSNANQISPAPNASNQGPKGPDQAPS